MRQRLIIGIDPGVTTAVVMLDLDGKIIDAKSQKFFSFNEIVSCISAIGEPIIVSSDVSPPPRLVQRVASAFGARLHYPPEIMTAAKKASMSKHLLYKLNDHERDAYVAATIAFEKFRKDFEKIDSLMQGSEATDEAKNIFVKGAASIKKAVESVNTVKTDNGTDLEKLRKNLEDRAKEISLLRKMLSFYRKGKAAPVQMHDNDRTKELRLEKELLAAKQRAGRAEDSMKCVRKVFRRLTEGWVIAIVSADFKKDSIKAIENYEMKCGWIIFLNNAGISRDALNCLVSKGVQGIVCGGSKLISEFKTLSHLELSEAEFDYAGSVGAINPSSLRTGIESVRNDFITWAKRVSDG